jgi:hypothetical protein
MNKNIMLSAVLATLVATNPMFAQNLNIEDMGKSLEKSDQQSTPTDPTFDSAELAQLINVAADTLVSLTTPANGSSPLSPVFKDFDSSPYVAAILGDSKPPDSFPSTNEAFLTAYTAMAIGSLFSGLGSVFGFEPKKAQPWVASSFGSLSKMNVAEQFELVSSVAYSLSQHDPLATFLVTDPSTTKALNQTIKSFISKLISQPKVGALNIWGTISNQIMANNPEDSAAYKEAQVNLNRIEEVAKNNNLTLDLDLAAPVAKIPMQIDSTTNLPAKISAGVNTRLTYSQDMQSSLINEIK